MLTFQVRDAAQEVINRLHEENIFTQTVYRISELSENIEDPIKAIGIGSNVSGHASTLHSMLASLNAHTAAISPRKFYFGLESLQETLNSFKENIYSDSIYIDDLIEGIEAFAAFYDKFLARPNGEHASPLLLGAPVLSKRLEDLEGAMKLFASALENQSAAHTGDGVLSLHLTNSVDLSEFIAQLAAIQSLYSEICQLLNISQVDEPLQIAKIESGSLWAKVVGSSVALGLVAHLIQSSATYLYHNYTTEGKIASVPSKVESLDKIVDLRKKLSEAGVRTKEMDEQLAKSAYLIAKDLNTLLDRQPAVTLNGREISVGSEALKKQISAHKTPRLQRNEP